MTRKDKTALLVAASFVALLSLGGATIVTSLSAEGVFQVTVREKGPCGDDVSIKIPASAAAVVLRFVPDTALHGIPRDALRYVELARETAEQLDGKPDVTLARVDGRCEKILVEKRGGTLLIDVDDEDTLVHIALPLRLLERVLRKFDRKSLAL